MPDPAAVIKGGASKYTIGRDKDCDVPIADDSVSRIHAELTLLDGGKLLLADRASANGTSIIQGGRTRRVEKVYVSPTDQVQFGSVVLLVSELIEAIRAKSARRPGEKRPVSLSAKLIRCGCGAIKPTGRACPECGQ